MQLSPRVMVLDGEWDRWQSRADLAPMRGDAVGGLLHAAKAKHA